MALISPRGIFLRGVKGQGSQSYPRAQSSQRVTPSRSDEELTENVAKVGNQMDIPLLDHIIVR